MAEEKDAKPVGKADRPQKVFANMWFDGNCAEALSFYVKAFECKKVFCMDYEGCIVHACIQFHNKDNMIFLSDVHGDHFENGPSKAGTSVNLFIYVNDVDKACERAKGAGCTIIQEPEDQFWGDRTSRLKDPFGHSWLLATHKFEPGEEMAKEGKKWWIKMKEKGKKRKRDGEAQA
mmetsp:Transcript_23876/g.44611  ORF Transcript_23876/g.44611 Transcript_23876/m.44611 type:complete len:176 (-) Transcript_23876:376-903(-)